MSLYLKQLEIGPMQNFQYLIGDTEAKKCWIVDPAWNVEDVLQAAASDGYSVEGALITHSHYDHCNSLDKLLKTKDMPVYVNKREIDINKKVVQTGIFGFLPEDNLKLVESGDSLALGETKLTFLHTPGHTPGSQCFLVNGNLISGDTLFIGTCGRCDLPGGNPYELFESLNNKLSKLPDNTMLFPGHNYSQIGPKNSLGAEKKANRFFHAHTLDEFLGFLGL